MPSELSRPQDLMPSRTRRAVEAPSLTPQPPSALNTTGAAGHLSSSPAEEHSDEVAIERPVCGVCYTHHHPADLCLGPRGPDSTALGLLTARSFAASGAACDGHWAPLSRRDLPDYDMRLELGMKHSRSAVNILIARKVLSASLPGNLQEDIAYSACVVLGECTPKVASFLPAALSLPSEIDRVCREYSERNVSEYGTAAVGQVLGAIPAVVYLLLQWLSPDFATPSNPTSLEWHVIRRFCRGTPSPTNL